MPPNNERAKCSLIVWSIMAGREFVSCWSQCSISTLCLLPPPPLWKCHRWHFRCFCSFISGVMCSQSLLQPGALHMCQITIPTIRATIWIVLANQGYWVSSPRNLEGTRVRTSSTPSTGKHMTSEIQCQGFYQIHECHENVDLPHRETHRIKHFLMPRPFRYAAWSIIRNCGICSPKHLENQRPLIGLIH